ncbi:Uncharacterized protein Rs2_14809 [Raphanus sativus]|nr:Uncharacterized protein Rs2_14809 [Raphanus sativus]
MCCVFGCVWPNAPPHRVDCRGISARVRRSSPSQAPPPHNPPESELHAIVIAPPKPSLILISIPWIRHLEVPESCSALVRIVVVNRSGEKKIEQPRFVFQLSESCDVTQIIIIVGANMRGWSEKMSGDELEIVRNPGAHPEARAYRVKTIPIYPNLCFTFGKEVSDERYTRLAQAFDPTPAETLRINESEAKMDSRILFRWCKPAKRKMITSVAVVVLLV